jgi:hypothetical protein
MMQVSFSVNEPEISVFNLTMWNLIGKLKKNVGRCPEEI